MGDIGLQKTSAAVGGIAVVIPSYNRKHLILDSLESVANQTLLPDKVFLVDDGSSDGTQQVVEEWKQSRAPGFDLVYIYQSNAGPGAARNRGIQEAAGYNWVALLDSDDVWHPEHLYRLVEAILEHPDAVAASNELEERHYAEDGSLLSSRAYLFSPELVSGRIVGPAAFRFIGPLTQATMIRRDILLAAGGFDHRLKYAEDKLLFIIVSTMGRWCRIPGYPVVYRNFVRNTGKQQTGAKQLSDRPHQNSRLAYARLLDEGIGHLAKSDERYHRGVDWALWKAWYRAGRHLEMTGHFKWAAGYYLKAARYRPFSKAIARCYLARLKCLWSRAGT